jgi:streptomycin 3"-adenylyltransferase
MRYEFPRDTPRSVRETLKETLANVHSILGEDLAGVYLYGSLAMECFQPASSDIDLILVVKEKPIKEMSDRIFEYLKRSSKDRHIELSLVTMDAVQNPQYPMLVDLHYEWWGNTFENEEDSEILSNLYTTRQRGFRVWGAPISDVFSKIPAHYHLRSVIEDLEHTRRHLHESADRVGYDAAVYWVLGSCRVLAFMREGKVLSKLEGGRWGLANLPLKYHNLIEQALSCYRGRKKNRTWNHDGLEAFADYMTSAMLRKP